LPVVVVPQEVGSQLPQQMGVLLTYQQQWQPLESMVLKQSQIDWIIEQTCWSPLVHWK
jgi:hypothetical protein